MNEAKTEVIIFNTAYYNNKCSTSSVSVAESTVEVSEVIKLLGVHFDLNLTFKYHIRQKCRAANYSLSLIRRIRSYLDTETCKLVVHAMVISHIDYANSLYVGLPESSLHCLQLVQNQAARLILQRSKYSSATQCLLDLHWLPVHFRCDFKVACLVYRCLQGQAPRYLMDCISVRTSRYNIRRLNSDTGTILNTPFARTNAGARCFSVYGPKIWNNLPQEIRLCDNFIQFRAKLKTHYFSRAFNIN